MIQKKVCLLGAFAVGKTSLVSRFVSSIFSETYLTTIGVKIDKRVVTVGERQVNLVLWDLAGEDAFTRIEASYLRGATGFFLVADGTRIDTLDRALDIRHRATAILPDAPSLLLINKADLEHQWAIDEQRLSELAAAGFRPHRVSAKTGAGVVEAFQQLTDAMVGA